VLRGTMPEPRAEPNTRRCSAKDAFRLLGKNSALLTATPAKSEYPGQCANRSVSRLTPVRDDWHILN